MKAVFTKKTIPETVKVYDENNMLKSHNVNDAIGEAVKLIDTMDNPFEALFVKKAIHLFEAKEIQIEEKN